MDATLYKKQNHNASLELSVTQRKLTRIVGKLHDPRIRPNERGCLLLYAGEILISFLGRDTRGVG